ncbi:unnamed protein product [Mytilus edulis]|uniref:Uncharacterized protein n=1 Tax=Mytilus edulis TaxID=6550 RepID=A0A8S3UMQ2_MYTED|nr:unnamed protein product [Mytilus edulis]
MLRAGGNIHHHGEVPEADEELSPSLENLIVLTWLRLINRDLPNLVKQRYGTELRSKTLASLKPEISQALDSLLDEIHSATDAKVLRASIKDKHFDRSAKKTGSIRTGRQIKCCILCKQAGRPSQHFLSTCKYLPDEDKQYMSRVRQSYCTEVGDSESEDNVDNEQVSFLNDNVGPSKLRVVSALRRVSTKQSPYFKAFYKHFPLELTLDTGAEVSMIKASSADYIGVTIKKSNHSALQADGVTPLNIVGECHFTLSRDGIELQLEALVVNDLDVDILAGIPFMSSNDIAIFPSKHKIVIRDKVTVMYGSPNEELNSSNTRVRRTQAFLIRAPSASSVVWPGCYGEYDIPSEIESDCILAVEPHTDASRTKDWPSPQIAQSVAGKIRIVNNTSVPQFIQRNEHFCRVRLTTTIDNAPEAPDNIHPDNLLSPDLQTQNDSYLKQLNISIEIGRVKNRNKNPVADKAIAELEDELLREEHDHSPLSENTLVIATTRLNSRLRQRGLSSRELWTQRSQFTHEQLPISDMNLIRAQHEARNKNHGFSENSKCSRPGRPTPDINIGDLVYLYTDRSKTQSRDRYLVVARDGEWCFIKKFSGNQLRASSYKVKLSECYKVLNTISAQQNPRYSQNVYNQESDSDGHDEDSLPGPIRDLPPDRAEPPAYSYLRKYRRC